MKSYGALGVGLNLAAALTLAACASSVPVQTEIKVVKEPVAVQPIKPADVPVVPAPLGPRPPTLRQSADRAFGGWCDAVAYFLRADPLLRLSAGLPPLALPPYPECEKH